MRGEKLCGGERLFRLGGAGGMEADITVVVEFDEGMAVDELARAVIKVFVGFVGRWKLLW